MEEAQLSEHEGVEQTPEAMNATGGWIMMKTCGPTGLLMYSGYSAAH